MIRTIQSITSTHSVRIEGDTDLILNNRHHRQSVFSRPDRTGREAQVEKHNDAFLKNHFRMAVLLIMKGREGWVDGVIEDH